MKSIRFVLISLSLLAGTTSGVQGQKKVVVGSTVDLTVALDDNPRVSETGGFRLLETGFTSSYAPRGTIYATLTGQRTTGKVFYTLGLNRFTRESGLNYESHVAGGEVSMQLSRRLKLSLHETYLKSPDFATATILGGIRVTPEGLFFDYDNVLLRRSGFANTAVASVDFETSPVSHISFQVNHRVRKFEDSPGFHQISNQNSIQGTISYSRRLNDRTSWDVQYSLGENDFQNFENSRSHNVTVGFLRQLSPNWSLRFGGGPSLSTSTARMSRSNGYNSNAQLTYSVEGNHLSLMFNRYSGGTTGVGSVSDVNNASLGFDRVLFAGTVLQTAISFYDSQPLFDNPVNLRGYGVDTSYAIPLKRTGWALVIGGSLYNQAGTEEFSQDRIRVFATLRFDVASLFSF